MFGQESRSMRKLAVVLFALSIGAPAFAVEVGGVKLDDKPAQADLRKAMLGG
jgi:hypothetical protein